MVSSGIPELFGSGAHALVDHSGYAVDGSTIDGHASRHDDGASDEITGQLDPKTSNASGHITLLPENYNSIGQGTFAIGTTTNAIRNELFDTTTAADGDNYTFEAFMAKGTYTMRVIGSKSSSRGIVDFDIDGVEVSSWDMYDPSGAHNQVHTETGITISESGIKTITVRTDGKNASSTGYYFPISQIAFWRTG